MNYLPIESEYHDISTLPCVVEEMRPIRKIDQIANFIKTQIGEVDFPVIHRFTPGMYIREIYMPKGTLVISGIHKTEHPYVISKGSATVWTHDGGCERLNAPHTGITYPGTQRILFIHEDCIWTTFHPATETTPEEVLDRIIQSPDEGSYTVSDEMILFLQGGRAITE